MLSTLLIVLAAAPGFGFAFSNETGDRLLSLTPLTKPAELTKVSCDGKVFSVKYLSEQPEGPKFNGRQTARHFAQVKGPLFQVEGGRVPADAQCLLGTDATFAARKVFPVTAAAAETACDEKTATLAAKLGARKVAACFSTGTIEGGSLAFARFTPKGANALVGVLLQAEGAAAMRAFPAKISKGPTCWRVDDSCQFGPDAYRVMFAMNGPDGWELFALWGGAEGENAELLRLKGSVLSAAASASRYWSPE